METLLSPTVIGIIIQTLGAIIVALITKIVIIPQAEKESTKKSKRPSIKLPVLVSWAIAGLTAGITFGCAGLIINFVAIGIPNIAIESPVDNGKVDIQTLPEGGAIFTVSGSSSKVANNQDLRIITLVHPAKPFARGWWIQSSAINDLYSGDWETVTQLGSKDYPPKSGDEYEILSIVLKETEIPSDIYVADPKDLKPLAQSKKIHIFVGIVK